MKPITPAAPHEALQTLPRARGRRSESLPPLPLGTAVYDPDVHHRAERVVTELVDSFPDLEAHVDRLKSVIELALREQDRSSRADEVLGRFSPSVRHYIRRQASGAS